MPDLPKIPCIENMVKLMGETMSEQQANAMLNEAVRRTKQIVEAEKIPEWAAAQRVANQMKQEQKMLDAITKRSIVRDTAAQFQLRNIAKEGGDVWAKNVQKFLQKVENTANALGAKHVAGFLSDLAERNQLKGWFDQKNHLDIWKELEQLNFQKLGLEHKAGFTGNKQAIAVAEVFFKRRMDIQATNNRWGAYTEEVPGYMFLQTHSADRLRVAGQSTPFGSTRLKAFGKESMSESYRVWRQSMDSLNIDWGRSVAGEDKEQFLKNFHTAVYTNIHGGPMEQAIESRKFKKPGTSIPDKLSSQRLLWFADAESAYKYNEMWGVHNTPDAITATLKTGGRNTAMLMNLGTRPVDNVEIVRERLLKDVIEEKPENAQRQEKELANRITGQMNLLTGRANISTRPWLSDSVDFLKNITMASKGGSIVLSAFSDAAFIRSRMAYEGLSALEQVAEQFRLLSIKEPRLKAEFGIYSQAAAGANQSRWDGDVRPVLGTQKLVQWVMNYQGLNRWTEHMQSSMGLVVAKKLADDSHLPWEKLDARRQKILTGYGYTPKRWDVIRTAVHKWGDEWNVITPSKLQELPDELVAKLVDGTPTAAGIRRMKDELEAQLDFYIYDAITEGVPTPNAAVRSIRTLNGTQRGEWSREFAELAFVFKSFPIKAAMTMSNQAKNIGGGKGIAHILFLVAQAGALGYLSGVAKDAVKGRTPKRLLEKDGTVNGSVWLDAVMRGGGLGIYGDLLLSDYDRRYRNAFDIAAGPVLGEMSNALSLYGKTRRVALGEDTAESLRYEAFRTVESNLPIIGMFPIKPVLEHLVMWHLREALSPGVWRRTRRSVEENNHQEYFIEPVQ